MAWIKSYQELERHPKTMRLKAKMGWDLDRTIGKLHRLWWWCGDYAYNGDLTRHNSETIAGSCGVDDADADKFVEALVDCGFVDRRGEALMLHDWWAHFGDFLRGKFSKTPEVWKKIEAEYSESSAQVSTSLTPGIHQVDTKSGREGGQVQGYRPSDKQINKEREKEKSAAAPFVLPDWVDATAWGAYSDMRARIRKPMTVAAMKMAVQMLDALRGQGYEPKKVLGQSVFNSWQGLFPIRGQAPTDNGTVAKVQDQGDKFLSEMELWSKTEKFHEESTRGGKCRFCGKPVEVLGVCYCAEYQGELEKIKEIRVK